MEPDKPMISLHDMVLIAVFAAVLCAAAPFSIAIGPVPLSLATLVIYLSSGTLGWKYGTVSVILYITLGAAGLPVFSHFEGGFHKIAGLTGGYIVGYIPLALAAGLVFTTSEKRWSCVPGMVTGTVLLYTFGTIWFMLMTKNTLPASLVLTVLPFLPGDVAKIITAGIIIPKLWAALKR